MRHLLHRTTTTGRLFIAALAASGAFFALACGGSHSDGANGTIDGAASNKSHPSGGDDDTGPEGDGGVDTSSDDGSTSGDDSDAGGSSATPDGGSHGGSTDGGVTVTVHSDAGYPSGWLYTEGAKIYESNGNGGGTQWMGRGVNVDDIFLCGYNDTLWMTGPDSSLETLISTLMSGWKPTFVRMSLWMDSFPTVVSFVSDPSQYKTPMVGVINSFGNYPGVHVMVTVRSDASMIGQDTGSGDSEATGIPSNSTNTPSKSKYPTGTDAVYVALVDAFANSGFVLFALTNEPGGNTATNGTLGSAMNHAVGTIRAEEDRLGVPHHIVSVQGNSWTSDISFYAQGSGGGYPDGGSGVITYDNVVYEVHGYPPTTSSYTYPNIPVIIGEYGSLPANDAGTDPSFFNDIENKQIPSLAWDFDTYSDCAPDLVNVNQSSTSVTTTSPWGTMVQHYLLSHAQ
jgi:hypothetical protein